MTGVDELQDQRILLIHIHPNPKAMISAGFYPHNSAKSQKPKLPQYRRLKKRCDARRPDLWPEAKGDIQAHNDRPRAHAGTEHHLRAEFDRVIIGLKVSHQAG
jgi:hypothetical protein